MALIGKIREKSWLLVAVVGIAMLAFVLGDLGSLGGGSQEDVYGIGTINGEKVDEDQYNTFLNNARNNIFQNKIQQNPNEQPVFTEADAKNAAQQAWTTSLIVKLMEKEYKNIGLVVDDYELENVLYGQNGYLPSSLSEQFLDSVTGEFAPDQLRMALDQLQNSDDPQNVQQYNGVIDYIRQERLEQKYFALLNAGVHATTLEAKTEYYAKKTVKNVSYVYERFIKVPEDAVAEPTDKEVKEFYDKNKNAEKYKQKANRKIAYFDVPVVASSDDSLRAFDFLTTLKESFVTAKNDSAFVMRYSDVKYYANDSTQMAKPDDAMSMTQGPTYPSSISAEIKNANIGDVVGPYRGAQGVTMSKILGFETEETATVRHILLNATTPEDVAAAQAKADSIIKVIRANGNFEDMVREFSQDPGSVENGGKYENFPQGMMVPEFNDFSFQKPIGSLGWVKTSYGIHIVEVLGREKTKYPIFANVVKGVETTKMTNDAMNSMVSNYIYDLDDKFSGKSIDEKIEIFENYAAENGYNVRKAVIQDESPSVSGFGDVAEGRVLRLAYDPNVKAGDISSSPILDRERLVVAMVTEVVKEGVPTFDIVKDQMTAEVKKQKQADYLIDKMVGQTDLEALAREMDAQYETEGITFSASNVAVGNEPKLIGAAFAGLKDGETSVPVKGTNGVFVLRVDETTPAEETTDYSAEMEQIKNQNVSTVQSQFQTALMQSAKVIDNRKLRSFGIR